MKIIERDTIDSDLLRTFLVIAQCGTLTVAAGQLHRTQSAISVQLRKLEQGLGAKVFNRTPKGMTLTAAGELLRPKAQSIVADIKDVSTLFAQPLTGSIRVGLPDDFDEYVLETVLSSFAKAHPGVTVIAQSGCTSGFPTAIGDGTLDIAVCSGPDSDDGEMLALEKPVWAINKKLQLSTSSPLPLAILDRTCWWKDMPIKALEAAGKKHTIAFRSSSFASLQAAVRAGIAVSVLPVSCIRENIIIVPQATGLPDLPVFKRATLVATHAPKDLTNAMGLAIKEALQTQTI